MRDSSSDLCGLWWDHDFMGSFFFLAFPFPVTFSWSCLTETDTNRGGCYCVLNWKIIFRSEATMRSYSVNILLESQDLYTR